MVRSRSLTKYVAGMAVLASLIAAAFLMLAHIGAGLREDGHIINVAGRQRMLSQQVALYTQETIAGESAPGRDPARARLEATLARMRTEHLALRTGDPRLGVPVPAGDQRSGDAARRVDELVAPFFADAEIVAYGPVRTPAAQAAALRVRAAAAGPLLAALDAEVGAYDERSAAHQARLQLLVVLSAVLVLSGGLAIAVPLGLSLRRDRARLVSALITEQDAREELRRSAAFHDAVLAASPDLMFVVDLRTASTVWVSPLLEHALGYGHAEIEQLGPAANATLLHPDDLPLLNQANATAVHLADGQVHALRYRVRHADGTWRVLARRMTPFQRDEHGRVRQILVVARDVTESADSEEKLRRAALHDPLTGLPNRAHLAQSLAEALGRARTPVAVLFCDLDGFKAVNDTGGHNAGDQVLTVTAARLRAAVRPHDLVARVGGDEFVVVLHPNPERDPRTDALKVADRITRVVAQPVAVGGAAYSVSVSTGITVANPGDDPGATLHAADTAMYRAKALGKNRAHELA